jgi:hypothetical protein
MSTADPLQQETGHFCLPVKLCLRHSKLLLSLGGEGSHESSAPCILSTSLPSALQEHRCLPYPQLCTYNLYPEEPEPFGTCG